MKCHIGDICTCICSGGTPKSTVSEYYGGGIPWLNTGEINFNRIYSTEKTISKEGLDNSSAKMIDKHCVIIAMYGNTAGKSCINEIPLSTNQACCNLKVNESICDYRYLYYIISSKYNELVNLSIGGAQQNLNAKMIRDLEINLPPLSIQKIIADNISLLDDKIETNIHINDYLTQQKQLAFKTLMDSVDHSNIIKLESVASLQKKTWKPSDKSELLEHYSIPAFDEKKYPSFDESTTIQSNKTIVTSDCILVSKLNPETRRVWRPLCITDKAVCSTEFLAIVPKDKKYAQYIFGQIDSEKFTEYLINNATGSTGSRQRVLPGTAMLYELPWPEQSEIESYSNLAQSIDSKIRSNMLENEKLIELRDSLLPKLMTGEIDVSKLELDN